MHVTLWQWVRQLNQEKIEKKISINRVLHAGRRYRMVAASARGHASSIAAGGWPDGPGSNIARRLDKVRDDIPGCDCTREGRDSSNVPNWKMSSSIQINTLDSKKQELQNRRGRARRPGEGDRQGLIEMAEQNAHSVRSPWTRTFSSSGVDEDRSAGDEWPGEDAQLKPFHPNQPKAEGADAFMGGATRGGPIRTARTPVPTEKPRKRQAEFLVGETGRPRGLAMCVVHGTLCISLRAKQPRRRGVIHQRCSGREH
jgi:hypothetical protein